MKCKNCRNTINDEFKYCPGCGQRNFDKLTFGVLFNNIISNYFSVDARFFRSFSPLLFKPGHLATCFVEGKRLKYIHPVQFYVFASVMFFFLFSLISTEKQESLESSLKNALEQDVVPDSLNPSHFTSVKGANNNFTLNYKFDKEKLDSLISINSTNEERLKTLGFKTGDNRLKKYFLSQTLKFYEKRGNGIFKAIVDSVSIGIFFFLPLFALLLKFLFFKKGEYPGHLVFSIYFFSFLFFLFSIFLIINHIINIPLWTLLIISSIYLYFGIMRYFKVGFAVSLLKTVILMLSSLILMLPLSTIILLASIIFY